MPLVGARIVQTWCGGTNGAPPLLDLFACLASAFELSHNTITVFFLNLAALLPLIPA
jgi:hypothetical protein